MLLYIVLCLLIKWRYKLALFNGMPIIDDLALTIYY